MFLADMPRVVAHGPDDGFLAFDLCVWSEEQMVPGLSHIWSAAHTGSRSLGVKRVSGGKQVVAARHQAHSNSYIIHLLVHSIRTPPT